MKKFKTLVSFILIISLAMALVVPTKAFADNIPWYVDDNFYNYYYRDGNGLLGNILKWSAGIGGAELRPRSELWTGTGDASVYNSSTTNYYTPVNISNQDYYYDIYNPITNTYNTVNYTNLTYDPTYNSYYYDYTYNNYDYNTYVSYSDTYVTYNYICPEDPNQNKFFEIYFVLPDGRNSFNLTKDDLKGIVFSYDVDVYDTANVANTLGLFHLDGSLLNEIDSDLTISSLGCSFVDSRFAGGLKLNSNDSIFYITDLPDVYTLEFIFYVPQSLKNYSSNTDSSGIWRGKNTVVNSLSVGYHNFACDSNGNCYIDGVLKSSNLFFSHKNIYISDGKLYFRAESLYTDRTHYLITGMIFDEIRISEEILYTSNYTPRNEPFDSGIGFVVPDNPIEQNIYMQSFVKPSVWQFGGIRNPNPVNGEAYFALENNIVISAQQYLNGIWQEIPSAIYLDGSFHNLLGYDLTTLVYFGGNASSGSNFDVDLSTTNGLLRDIVNFLDDNFGYYSIGDDELELAESSFGDITNRALKPSWFDLLLPLIYLIFVLVFLLEFFNSVIAFIAFLVRMITIQASPSGIQEQFVLAFQWLRGETEEPFYLLSNGSLNLTCWDFMVILFELFFIGLVFAVIRKNIDKLSIPSFRK